MAMPAGAQTMHLTATNTGGGGVTVHLSMCDIPSGQASYEADISYDSENVVYVGCAIYDGVFGAYNGPIGEISPGIIHITRAIGEYESPVCCDADLADLYFQSYYTPTCGCSVAFAFTTYGADPDFHRTMFTDTGGKEYGRKEGLTLVGDSVGM